MRSSCRNRFIKKKLIRARVVPIISANVSWLIFGTTFSDLPFFPKRASHQKGPGQPLLSRIEKLVNQVKPESGCNDQPCRPQIGLKTPAHREVRSASRPFQFLGQKHCVTAVADVDRRGWSEAIHPSPLKSPTPTQGDGSLFATRRKDGEFCSTCLNIVIHLRDPACVEERHSEGNDPQLSNAIEWTMTDQINTAGLVRVSTSSDFRH
jgi:hypothetical protein